MGAQGITTIDFGVFPGSNEATTTVTGQGSILAGSLAEAWVMAEATADHTAQDHSYLPLLATFVTGPITAGIGFTINGRSEQRLQGTWNLKWVWN